MKTPVQDFESCACWAYLGALHALGIKADSRKSRELAAKTPNTAALIAAIEMMGELRVHGAESAVLGAFHVLDDWQQRHGGQSANQ